MSHFGMRFLCLYLLVLGFPEMVFAQQIPYALRAPAAINRAAINQINNISPELIENFKEIRASLKTFDAKDIVPMDLRPTDNSQEVFSHIADHSLTNWLNSAAVRATPIGQTAAEIEQKVKQDVTISDANNKIDHKFSFSVQAFQTMAKIDYSGFVNASLKYRASESATVLELNEPLNQTQQIYVNHTAKPSDRVSEVGMRWSF